MQEVTRVDVARLYYDSIDGSPTQLFGDDTPPNDEEVFSQSMCVGPVGMGISPDWQGMWGITMTLDMPRKLREPWPRAMGWKCSWASVKMI